MDHSGVMPSCHRCGITPLAATTEVFTDDRHYAWHLCAECLGGLYVYLQPIEGVDMTHTFIIYSDNLDYDDLDDAEHAGTCVCEQCDPDFRFEYIREERFA